MHNSNKYTFDQLPLLVCELVNEVQLLKVMLIEKSNFQNEIEKPINLDEVGKITELSKATLYAYVQRNEIPFYKIGNRLKFFKSEIIEWIKSGKQKTVKEVEADADEYLSNRTKKIK